MFSVIIVSAGKGQRYQKSFGQKNRRNKTLELVGQIPVFIHSLLAFNDPCFHEIILTVSSDDYQGNIYTQTLSQYGKEIPDFSSLASRIKIIPGGKERYHSVVAGLDSCSPETRWVFIHDAARPLIHREDLIRIQNNVRERLDQTVGILPVTPPIDTIKEVDETGWVVGNLHRSSLRAASTPQCFPHQPLQEAYQKWKNKQMNKEIPTDDSEFFFSIGYPVLTVDLHHPNPKLTTADDLEYLNRIWKKRSVFSSSL